MKMKLLILEAAVNFILQVGHFKVTLYLDFFK